MVSFVDGTFFHHRVSWQSQAMDAPPRPPRVVSELPPKHRPRSRPTSSACIIHSGTAPPIHGSETLSEPAARDKWKMEPCHLLVSGTAAHASRSVAFFERNLVQGTSEVIGRGQAKEAMSNQAKQAQPPSAEEGSHFVVATRACERNSLSSRRSLGRLGV